MDDNAYDESEMPRITERVQPYNTYRLNLETGSRANSIEQHVAPTYIVQPVWCSYTMISDFALAKINDIFINYIT